MLKHDTDDRDGALMRRLKDLPSVGGSRTGRFGFATGGPETRKRPMLVLARITSSSTLKADLTALVEAGVDAVEIEASGQTSGLTTALTEIKVPCGLRLGSGATGTVATAGLDWITVGLDTAARFLGLPEVTRVVEVTPDLPPGRLGGLGALKAEIIAVAAPRRAESLSVDTLLVVGAIEAATRRPVLVDASLGLTPDDVKILYEQGVDGVIVDGTVEQVRAYASAVEAL
jgi:hypothetical protein